MKVTTNLTKLFILPIFLILTLFNASPQAFAQDDVGGRELKFITGRAAERYFKKSIQNSDHSYGADDGMWTPEERKQFRANQVKRQEPSNSVCTGTLVIERWVKPIGLADTFHSLKNGTPMGDRETNLIPFVNALCTEAIKDNEATYACMLTFDFGSKGTKGQSELDEINANNASLEKLPEVIDFNHCAIATK